MNLIDTHCHLFDEQFDPDLMTVIARAQSVGVSRFLLPNIDSTTIPALHSVCERFPGICLPMMGLHPTSVNDNYKEELQIVEEELHRGSYIAIGEIGLDYYWDLTFKEAQKEAFREQLRWAKEMNLPVAIHTRNSFDDAIKIVEEEKTDRLNGVFHCFSGSVEEADRITALGFYMGIGGVVTFKNAGLDKVLPGIPEECFILETDSPYLAPVPYRGKRNESSYLKEIVTRLADIKAMPAERMAEITTANARKLFRLVD